MSDLRAAAKQALDALEMMDRVMQRSPKTNAAVDALRAALAAPTVPSDCPPNSRQLKQAHETE